MVNTQFSVPGRCLARVSVWEIAVLVSPPVSAIEAVHYEMQFRGDGSIVRVQP